MRKYRDSEASIIREKLVKIQNHKSPITGLPLHGRLEKHHKEEKIDGGTDDIENLMVLPRPEHIFDHFDRSLDETKTESERLREIQTVADRIVELDDNELSELNQLIRSRTKSKVHFV